MILKPPLYLAVLLAIVCLPVSCTSTDKIVSVRVGGNEHRETLKPEKCEEIRVPLCRNLPYTRTSKLNAYGRVDQSRIIDDLSKYEHYFKLNCSTFFESFVCSYHLPLCSTHSLLPCSELCQQVHRDCSQAITAWPSELECDKFPAYKKTKMCFKPKELDQAARPPVIAASSPLQRPANFVCPIEMRRSSSQYVFRMAGLEMHNCSYGCHDFLYDQPTERLVRTNIVVIATISLLLNLFLQVTYRIDTDRFKYPLKAIVHISFCYMLVSIVYLIGYFAGDTIACDLADDWEDERRVPQTLAIDEKLTCKLSFVLLNFFTSCSLLWWLLLAVTFFLEMVFQWASEVIERRNALFHVLVLALGGAHTTITVWNADLQGDVLSGLCTVRLDQQLNYLIVPQAAVLAAGLLIFAITIGHFFKIKQFLKRKDMNNAGEFETFVYKLLAFLLLYLIGYGGQFVIHYYELHEFDLWTRHWYQTICTRFGDRCPAYWRQPVPGGPKPSTAFATLKYSSHFLPCIACGALLFCRKTLETWSKFCKNLFRKTPKE